MLHNLTSVCKSSLISMYNFHLYQINLFYSFSSMSYVPANPYILLMTFSSSESASLHQSSLHEDYLPNDYSGLKSLIFFKLI